MQCKVQDMEKNNESLQVMFDEMLKRNTQLLKEKEQQKAIHQEMQFKLQDMEAIHDKTQSKLQVTEKKNEGLQVMLMNHWGETQMLSQEMQALGYPKNTPRDAAQ